MAWARKATDAQITAAAERIAQGELRSVIAREYGMTVQGLSSRLAQTGVPPGQPGRPKGQPARHCRSCRCVVYPARSPLAEEFPCTS